METATLDKTATYSDIEIMLRQLIESKAPTTYFREQRTVVGKLYDIHFIEAKVENQKALSKIIVREFLKDLLCYLELDLGIETLFKTLEGMLESVIGKRRASRDGQLSYTKFMQLLGIVAYRKFYPKRKLGLISVAGLLELGKLLYSCVVPKVLLDLEKEKTSSIKTIDKHVVLTKLESTVVEGIVSFWEESLALKSLPKSYINVKASIPYSFEDLKYKVLSTEKIIKLECGTFIDHVYKHLEHNAPNQEKIHRLREAAELLGFQHHRDFFGGMRRQLDCCECDHFLVLFGVVLFHQFSRRAAYMPQGISLEMFYLIGKQAFALID